MWTTTFLNFQVTRLKLNEKSIANNSSRSEGQRSFAYARYIIRRLNLNLREVFNFAR